MGSGPTSGVALPGPQPAGPSPPRAALGEGPSPAWRRSLQGGSLYGVGGAVEHAHAMGRQELHKLGIVEGIPSYSERWRPLGQRCTGSSRHQGHSGHKHILGHGECDPGEAGQERTGQITPPRESGPPRIGPRHGQGAGQVKGSGGLWTPLPARTTVTRLLLYIRVPMGYCLEKHVGFHCRAEPPAAGILCSCPQPCLWAWHCWQLAQVTWSWQGPPLLPRLSTFAAHVSPGLRAAWGLEVLGLLAQTRLSWPTGPLSLGLGFPWVKGLPWG